MTENKRFVKHYAGRTEKRAIGIKDIETNRVCVTIDENICLLNELADENKELKKRLKYAEKVNTGLIDENHRLRLTIIHSSDLNFDIEWLKENLKEDWNNE